MLKNSNLDYHNLFCVWQAAVSDRGSMNNMYMTMINHGIITRYAHGNMEKQGYAHGYIHRIYAYGYRATRMAIGAF